MEIKDFKPEEIKKKIFKKQPKPWRKTALKVLLAVLLLALLGVGAYAVLNKAGIIDTFKTAYQIQKQKQLTSKDQKILDNLKKIIRLPEGVTPSMAVITDIDALKKQQPDFFADAKNDDRLVIYPQMAIIYDAAANQIIKVGPVQLPPAAKPVPFAIYNSTSDDSKVQALEDTLKKAFNNVEFPVAAKAVMQDYPQTLVIDLIGKNPDMEKIAQAIGGKVSTLPDGEKKPEGAEVLVIIGKQ